MNNSLISLNCSFNRDLWTAAMCLLQVSNFDGTMRTTVMHDNMKNLRALTLDPRFCKEIIKPQIKMCFFPNLVLSNSENLTMTKGMWILEPLLKFSNYLIRDSFEMFQFLSYFSKGLMFWTDWEESNPRIERATMAGNNRRIMFEVLEIVNGGWPNGLTCDFLAERIYWIDAK